MDHDQIERLLLAVAFSVAAGLGVLILVMMILFAFSDWRAFVGVSTFVCVTLYVYVRLGKEAR